MSDVTRGTHAPELVARGPHPPRERCRARTPMLSGVHRIRRISKPRHNKSHENPPRRALIARAGGIITYPHHAALALSRGRRAASGGSPKLQGPSPTTTTEVANHGVQVQHFSPSTPRCLFFIRNRASFRLFHARCSDTTDDAPSATRASIALSDRDYFTGPPMDSRPGAKPVHSRVWVAADTEKPALGR